VVIDPNFRMPDCARMLGDGAAPILAVQCEERPRGAGVEPLVIARRGETIAPDDIVAALNARGYRRILVEGGASTVSAFLAAGALHRFHLSIAPIVIGSGPVGINLPPIDELDGALRPSTMTHQLGEDVVFDCDFEAAAI
jgi:riboflavin biosynthesis pyrimidine reductase